MKVGRGSNVQIIRSQYLSTCTIHTFYNFTYKVAIYLEQAIDLWGPQNVSESDS